MSQTLLRSISSSRRCANLLAVCYGVAVATLASSAFSISCRENIGPFTEGIAFSVGVAAIPVPSPTANPPGLPYSIDWGDGTTSGAVVGRAHCVPIGLGLVECSVGIAGFHTYLAVMSGISIKVHGTGPGSPACTTNAFDVLSGPPSPGGDVLSNPRFLLRTATPGVPISGVIMTVTDSNPSVVVSDFTALIDWGDGTQSEGVVSASAGTLSVSAVGDHAYIQRGSFTVLVSLAGAATAEARGTVRVGRQRH